MTDDDPRLSGAYVTDALTDEERAEYERALAGDPDLQEEIHSLRDTVHELTHLSSAAPPPSLRENTLTAIQRVQPLPPRGAEDSLSSSPRADNPSGSTGTATALGSTRRRRSARSRASAWLAAAVAAAAIVALFVVLGQRETPPQNTAAAVMSASDVTSYGHEDPSMSMTLYVSPSHDKAVIMSDDMPDAPQGRDFQVWLLMPDGSMVDGGVLPHTGDNEKQFVVSGAIDQATGIALTDEPTGGSEQPTSPPVVEMSI